MSKLNPQEVLEDMKSWTLLQFNDFIKSFEEEFQVSAAAAMVAAPVAATGGAAAADAEPTTVSLVLTSTGDKKIQVIKVVREITGLGLKEAKDLVDGAPKPVKEGITPEEAETLKAKFADSGATVEVK